MFVARRVVFDTNVLVSGYLWQGSARRCIERVRSGKWILLSSKDTINELIRVLAYDKFGLSASEIQPILYDLTKIGEFVDVTAKISVITTDPTDNIFLALATDGRADVIVSGDHHLLNLKKFRDIPIVTVRKFLAW